MMAGQISRVRRLSAEADSTAPAALSSSLPGDRVEDVARSEAPSQAGAATAPRDRELVGGCIAGEPEAFKELLARYRRSAVTLAYQLLGNAEDAEDVAQEAFVRVFQAIPHFRQEAAFPTWLYRIVTNLCLGRQRRRKLVVEMEATGEPRAPGSTSDQVTEGLAARQVMALLPPAHRAVLVLREQEGMSYREIATALDLPVGTVRSRLSKARSSFRRLWTQMAQDGWDRESDHPGESGSQSQPTR